MCPQTPVPELVAKLTALSQYEHPIVLVSKTSCTKEYFQVLQTEIVLKYSNQPIALYSQFRQGLCMIPVAGAKEGAQFIVRLVRCQ